MKHLKSKLLIVSYLTVISNVFSQQIIKDTVIQHQDKNEKVVSIYNEIEVHATPEKAWDIIAIMFPNIGDFHPKIDYSFAVDKTLRFGKYAIRHCQINDKKYIRDQIISWDKNNMTFTYQMIENLGLRFTIRQCDFGVKIKNGRTYIYHRLQYRMNSNFWRKRKKKKLVKANVELLKAYQNEIGRSI